MKHEDNEKEICAELERYLALAERAWIRMVETGKWPWRDDPDFDL